MIKPIKEKNLNSSKNTKQENGSKTAEYKTPDLSEPKKRKGLSMIDKLKLRLSPQTTFIVNMHYSNGTKRIFVVNAKDETFDHKGRTYYLRYEDAWFDLTNNQYILNFFDDYAIPIDREVMRKEDPALLKDPKLSKFARAYWSVTPHNLKPLIKMEYVKALAESHDITKYLKLILLFTVISLFILVIIGYGMYKGGVLKF